MKNGSVARWLAFAVLVSAMPAAAQEKVVNVYNWNDYIAPDVLDLFTKETGIKVVYDIYDNNEIVETKMLAGKSGYDLVVPSGPFLQRMVEAGVFEKLDKAKLPNLKNQWPEIAKKLTAYDPGNQYAINYMWGTTGIGYNVDKVKAALGDVPVNTWDLVLKPDVVEKLKGCGVNVLDAPEDVFPGVMRYLGMDTAAPKAEQITKAAEHLLKIRPSVRTFNSSSYINDLASGDICITIGYSGDVLQARRRAEEAKNGVNVQYVIPREGALMWFDSFVMPKDAPNKDNAYAFLNFMMRPDIAAKNANAISYASGNLAAKAEIRPDILNNPNIYPDPATFARLFTNSAYPAPVQKVVTRQWTRVKTGK
ncbi:MAG: polyamine ABC transporter substrate-binding protein [Proteobacteria bacterium]|nr:polyamine ABC transporter substrate-binding protein [Pseudomonadota bacterium]